MAVNPDSHDLDKLTRWHEGLTAAARSPFPVCALFLVSGDNTFVRHGVPSERVIEENDIIILCELAGVHRRYVGPLFRTFYLGDPPEELVTHSEIAREMLEALFHSLRPGRTSDEVESDIVAVARKSGLEEGVSVRTGYSVGLNFPPDWGEGVFLDLNAGNETPIQAGMVFHVPQTIRLGDSLPTAISETLVVTENGAEALTDFEPRDLVVLS